MRALRSGETDVARAEVQVGIALSPDEGLRHSATPLFAAGSVDVVSWSFDGVAVDSLPTWLSALLAAYADAGRVTLHGVAMSPLTALPQPQRREAWLRNAASAVQRWSAPTLSEHFGFGAAGDVIFGAPLPLPCSRATVALGKSALQAIASHTGALPGFENLALAFQRDDALLHGAFLEALTSACEGAFLVLDLHNLLCQASTFELSVEALLAAYPLERVRELHVAGGRTMNMLPDTRPVRRDTHDAALPEDLFLALPTLLARCPNLRCVILERLPGTLEDGAAQADFARDFRKLRELVRSSTRAGMPPPSTGPCASTVLIEDDPDQLERLQRMLLHTLQRGPDAQAARVQLLQDATLAPYHDWLCRAEPRMLETARQLVQRWSLR